MSSSPSGSASPKKKKKKKKKKKGKRSKEDEEAERRQSILREKEKRKIKAAAEREAVEAAKDPYPAVIRSTQLSVDELVAALDRPYGKPKVTTLDLGGSMIGDEATGRIANHMKKNGRSIETLVLFECALAARSAVRLAPALLATRSLMDLDLSQNSIGDRGLKVLCGALMGNVTLKRLNMRETKLGATSGWVDPLCEVMSAKKNLTALDLSDNLMGRDGVTAISQALHAPACQLASLHLNLNPLCGLGVKRLALSIMDGAVTTLTELGLSSVEMDAQGALAIANAVASPNCNVAILSIDSNPGIGHEGVIALASIALKRTSCPLTTLRMGNIGLRRKTRGAVAAPAELPAAGKKGTKSRKDQNKVYTKYHLPTKKQKAKREVAPTLAAPAPLFRPFVEHAAPVKGVRRGKGEMPGSKSVRGDAGDESDSTVQVEGNAREAPNVSKAGFEAEAEGGADNKVSTADNVAVSEDEDSVAKKGVGKTRFDDAFDALGYALTQNKTLTSFDLSGAREIDDEAIAPLAAALGRNEGLQVVFLSGNCIGDEGACLIADALEDNPVGPLHTLDLHDNCVGDEGAANVAEVLGVDNKSLTTLDLRNQRSRLGGDLANPVPVSAPMDIEGVMAFATMLKTNCTLTSLDLRGNGILDLERTERVVETDAFAKAALRAVVYNPRACVMRVWGADFARVARVCYLPEEYQKRGANEDREEFNLRILRFAHRMDL